MGLFKGTIPKAAQNLRQARRAFTYSETAAAPSNPPPWPRGPSLRGTAPRCSLERGPEDRSASRTEGRWPPARPSNRGLDHQGPRPRMTATNPYKPPPFKRTSLTISAPGSAHQTSTRQPRPHKPHVLHHFLAAVAHPGAPSVFQIGPRPIHTRSAAKTSGESWIHIQCSPSFRHQKTTHVPVRPLSIAASSFPGTGRREAFAYPADRTLQDGYDPSPLSSSFIPGTTRKDTNGCTTALQCLRSAPADFYLRHSPRLRPLNHSPDLASTGHHPGSRSPSPVSDSRCTIGHVGKAG